MIDSLLSVRGRGIEWFVEVAFAAMLPAAAAAPVVIACRVIAHDLTARWAAFAGANLPAGATISPAS